MTSSESPTSTAYSGRYGYTGQAWIPSAQLWHYKARVYHPGLGRFLQPDPIGYWDSPNLYAYVLNDPVNLVDPLGLQPWEDWEHPPVEVIGERDIVWLADLGFGDFIKGGNLGFELILRQAHSGSPGHRTSTKSQVCQRALTVPEMKDLLSRFAIPGHEGQALTSGTYTVWGGRVPGGLVTTTFSRGGLRVTNVTTPLHVFVGQIQRDILIRNDQTFISTRGTGNAQMGVPGGFSRAWDLLSTARDLANQISGPEIFKNLDAAAAAYAKKHFEGC